MNSSFKKQITLWVAILSFSLGIIRLFYLLNREVKRVITFHNVVPENLLPGGKRIGIVNTEDEFCKILKEVGKVYSFSDRGNLKSNCLITFDDGYVNQLEVTTPILKKYGVVNPIIFVSGQNLDCDSPLKALTIDLLMHWVELVPEGEYILPDDSEKFEIGSDRAEVWQKVIWPAYNRDAKDKGKGLLLHLSEQYPLTKIFQSLDPEYLRLRLTGLNIDMINEAQKDGWRFGWHCRSHFPLSKLSSDEKESEFDSIPDILKGQPMSYPYGELHSVDAESLELASHCGADCAYSNLPDKNGLSGRWFLPRFTLPANKYLLHFELSGLKYFLKTRKLLPSS